ncbi:MAG: chorismate mutase [Salinibacter sp.]
MSTPTLRDARDSIDEIDRRVVELLARRYALVDDLCETKAENGDAVRDPDREQELLDRVTTLAEEQGLAPDVARQIYEEVLAQSVRRQRRRRQKQDQSPAVADAA